MRSPQPPAKPQPPKKPMVACGHCGTNNEPDRAKCRGCQKRLPKAAARPTTDPARAAAIAAIVAQAPPLTSDQLVTLRRIFASATPARKAA